ncbi:hypothetical protein HMPREF9946_04494 [Acetobacteraceae bacterium AT-5844]|nr:hypothetical protein HMPREF9946_04494 [Acetobacteraceae bacterium AT-5844]
MAPVRPCRRASESFEIAGDLRSAVTPGREACRAARSGVDIPLRRGSKGQMRPLRCNA